MKSFVIVVLSILFTTPACAFHNTCTTSTDLTYDGLPEQIVYEVFGDRWDQSVSWSLTVYSDDKELYRHVVMNDDNRVWYEDPGCIDHCTGLIDCRKEWFLKQAFPTMLVTVDSAEPRHDNLLQVYQKQAADDYRIQFGYTETQAIANVNRLAAFLEGREIVGFTLPESPVESGTLMVYDWFECAFVPFYHP